MSLCQTGSVQAIVTGPVNKEAVVLSGTPFTGHTEFIAELCGSDRARMLLVNDRLRVLHVTTHCALREACALTKEQITTTLRLGDEALRLLDAPNWRIAVCGLNPHAGEHGLFGDEEDHVIRPAVAEVCAGGIDCSGPFPADTLFHRCQGAPKCRQ